MRKRRKIGDVFSVKSAKGLSYMQYTHQNSEKGGLVRILQGFFAEPLSTEAIQNLLEKPPRFSVFFPIKHYSECPDIKLIGNFPIPPTSKPFPIFKGTNASPNTDLNEAIWWLWDGKNEWEVGTLTPQEQRKYPDASLLNDTALIETIETGEKYLGVPIC